MIRENQRRFAFDWLTILLYILLVAFGYLNIISASHDGEVINYFDISQSYGKHLIFIAASFGVSNMLNCAMCIFLYDW